jgi:hypothetical protein
VNLGKFGIDAAAFSNDSNVERYRHPSIAISLRFGNLREKSGGGSNNPVSANP